MKIPVAFSYFSPENDLPLSLPVFVLKLEDPGCRKSCNLNTLILES